MPAELGLWLYVLYIAGMAAVAFVVKLGQWWVWRNYDRLLREGKVKFRYVGTDGKDVNNKGDK